MRENAAGKTGEIHQHAQSKKRDENHSQHFPNRAGTLPRRHVNGGGGMLTGGGAWREGRITGGGVANGGGGLSCGAPARLGGGLSSISNEKLAQCGAPGKLQDNAFLKLSDPYECLAPNRFLMVKVIGKTKIVRETIAQTSNRRQPPARAN